MTWNPLKKKHITIRPTPAPPCLSSVEDRELDTLVQKLIQFEDTSKCLIKKVKQYYTQISMLDEADRHLTTHLCECSLVHVNNELKNVITDYHSVTIQVGKTVQSLKGLCLITFVEPLKKFRDEFIKIEASLAKREELVANWRIAYNRVLKLQEKKDRIASNIAKLDMGSKSVEFLSKELKEYHADLIITLRALIDKRIRIIKPCMHALMMIQLDYYGNITKMFTNLMSAQNVTNSPLSNSNYEKECKYKITSEMSRIKELAITKKLKF